MIRQLSCTHMCNQLCKLVCEFEQSSYASLHWTSCCLLHSSELEFFSFKKSILLKLWIALKMLQTHLDVKIIGYGDFIRYIQKSVIYITYVHITVMERFSVIHTHNFIMWGNSDSQYSMGNIIPFQFVLIICICSQFFWFTQKIIR